MSVQRSIFFDFVSWEQPQEFQLFTADNFLIFIFLNFIFRNFIFRNF